MAFGFGIADEAPEAEAEEDKEPVVDLAADLAAEPEPVSGVGAVPTLSSRGAVFWRPPMRNEGESGPVAEGDGGTEAALCAAPPVATALLPDAEAKAGACGPVGAWGVGLTSITDCETRVADEMGCTCTGAPRAGAAGATCAFEFALAFASASAEAVSCCCCCCRALPPPGVPAAAMLLEVMTADGCCCGIAGGTGAASGSASRDAGPPPNLYRRTYSESARKQKAYLQGAKLMARKTSTR